MQVPNLFVSIVFVLMISACQGQSHSLVSPLPVDGTNPEDTEAIDDGIGSGNPGVENPEDTLLSGVDIICGDILDAQSNCRKYSQSLLESLSTHNYLSPESVKVNSIPFSSDITADKMIQVYINAEHQEEFSRIDPDVSFSGIEINEGAIIIRELWSEDHTMDKYTAMIKMEKGYFPGGGDFAYAVIQHDGTVVEGGKLESCGSCHLSREDDGFVFGVRQHLKSENANIDSSLGKIAREVISEKQYLDNNEFFLVNDTPYPSALNPANYLSVYVSRFSALNYLTVHSDRENSDAHLAQETVIIREVKDINGDLKTITVMVKGPKNYYPEGGDFYYGVFDVDANVVNNNGVAQEGRLNSCGSCHNNERSNDGFLFGVSLDDRR